MAQDVIWQNASEEQLQDAQLAIERSVMNRIFKLAFYPNQDGDILRDQWVLLSDGLSRTIPASPPSLDKLFMRHNIWVVKEKIGPFLTSQSCQPAQKESLCSQRCAESGWRAVYAGLAVVEGTAAALLPFLLLPTLTLQIRTQTSLPWGKPFLACLSGWDALAALPQTRIPFFSTCHHCSFTLESGFSSWHSWHFGPDDSLMWGAALCLVGLVGHGWPWLVVPTSRENHTVSRHCQVPAPWGQNHALFRITGLCDCLMNAPVLHWMVPSVSAGTQRFIHLSIRASSTVCDFWYVLFIYWEGYVFGYQNIKKCMAYELNLNKTYFSKQS